MTTHENEITEPVDLCTPDGDRLNPAARGWSRRPLHRANLQGRFGVNKRWDYWAVLAGDVLVSSVYADVDHLGLADVWWADLATGATGGGGVVTVGNDDFDLPDVPGTAPLHVDRDGFELLYVDDEAGTRLTGTWTEPDGRPGRLDVHVALPPGHESLNVVIPWSDEVFNYTSKHQARPAVGELVVGDQRFEIGGAAGDAWGVLDVGRGRWPSEITWNWGGGAGRVGDHVVGLQFGAKWTEGSGFTENGVIVDGRLSKIGRELDWQYDWDEPMSPWRIVDPGGQLDVTLTPRHDKHSQLPGRDKGSETHQVFGTWSGSLRTDDGLELEVDGLQGFAEEARQEW
ncbi:MAG TPA: DUF2804 domain-containing protein [Acidimicrobiales bacterium]|nr:DUF2804 domain-containing protein [Acidimicrobiales bacterium]